MDQNEILREIDMGPDLKDQNKQTALQVIGKQKLI